MTSKERVRAAINHQEPDRVPLGEVEIDGPIVAAMLSRPTYYRAGMDAFLAYLEGRRDEVVESMKTDFVEFIRITGMDIACFSMEIVPGKDVKVSPLERSDNGDYRDMNGNVLRYSEETGTLVVHKRGEGPVRLLERGYEPTRDAPYDDSELEFARHVMSELGDSHYMVGPTHLGPPKIPFRGMNDLVMNLIDPVIQGTTEGHRDRLLLAAERSEHVGGYWKRFGADGAWALGGDIGNNQATFISPEHIRAMLLPSWKLRSEHIHDHGLSVFCHACGNNRGVWDQFVEAGFDVYQAIQMEEPLKDLKKEHGDRLTLMGGVSCRALDADTPNQIREQVKRAIDTAAAGGGFILASSHSLHAGVKYENFMAMLEAWHKYR